MNRLVTCLFFCLLSLGCAGVKPPLLVDVDRAAGAQKLLLVDFYASWCKPCDHFERVILTDPRVQAALVDFVFVRYDIETPAGRDAYRRCQGRSLPMVVGIDGQGIVRVQKNGTESTADEFLVFLAEARRVPLAP